MSIHYEDSANEHLVLRTCRYWPIRHRCSLYEHQLIVIKEHLNAYERKHIDKQTNQRYLKHYQNAWQQYSLDEYYGDPYWISDLRERVYRAKSKPRRRAKERHREG